MTFIFPLINLTAGTIPTEIWSLRNLEVLYLRNNKLSGALAQEIGNLKRLIWLSVTSNTLGGPIPSTLFRLTNIKYLGLGFNRFKWINSTRNRKSKEFD